jgi:hypothetical protein
VSSLLGSTNGTALADRAAVALPASIRELPVVGDQAAVILGHHVTLDAAA